MYQEDMVNQADGCGGMPIHPKISIQSSWLSGAPQVASDDELSDNNEQLPYNSSELSEHGQQQYHQYLGEPTPPRKGHSRDGWQRCSPSRSRSRSPHRLQPSVHKAGAHDDGRKSQDDYASMSTMEIREGKETKKRRGNWLFKRKQHDDFDDQYVANVALSIQCAMVFFCMLIAVVVVMSILSIRGYFVIIMICLVVLVSLSVGLCTFTYQVINEDDAPRVTSKYMPKWYNTFTEIIKEEVSNFREDWINMYDGLYLLEDGDPGSAMAADGEADESNAKARKKTRGKSAIFRLIAKPAAAFANFRRKRKEKKKQKKAAKESYFPPIV